MKKSKIGIIIGREYAIRVKKKSFIITTILTPLLFAALMIVPSLIAVYGGGDEEQKRIRVIDESGIVLPYLESGDEVVFEKSAEGESLASLKEGFKESELFAILAVSPLDSNKNLSVSVYSEKQLNVDLKMRIRRNANKALEEYKLRSYDIPDIEKVLEDIESDVPVSTFTIDESTGEEKASMVEIYMGIGYIASFLIYMFIFMFGSMVMRSVIEEKTTRIVEVIVSSVKPFELMMGKIVGVAAVGLTQFLIWIVITFSIVTVFSAVIGSDSGALGDQSQMEQVALAVESAGVEGVEMPQIPQTGEEDDTFNSIIDTLKGINYVQIILCFLIYFLLGYLLYSGMFAAVGSAVDNEADTQQLILPVTMPLIIGLFIMLHTFQYPDSTLSFWGSIIPFTSPMVMMARIAYGVPFWELALSIGLLVVTFLLLTWLSGKIYRIGILMYGKKASWRDLWRWIKIK